MRNIFSLNTFKINLCAWSLYRLFWRDHFKKKEDATQKRLNLVLEEGKTEDEIKKKLLGLVKNMWTKVSCTAGIWSLLAIFIVISCYSLVTIYKMYKPPPNYFCWFAHSHKVDRRGGVKSISVALTELHAFKCNHPQTVFFFFFLNSASHCAVIPRYKCTARCHISSFLLSKLLRMSSDPALN